MAFQFFRVRSYNADHDLIAFADFATKSEAMSHFNSDKELPLIAMTELCEHRIAARSVILRRIWTEQ